MSEMEGFFQDPNIAKLQWLLGSKSGADGAGGGASAVAYSRRGLR